MKNLQTVIFPCVKSNIFCDITEPWLSPNNFTSSQPLQPFLSLSISIPSFLLLLLFLSFSSSTFSNLIETTCTSTSYHDLCVSAIGSAGPRASSAANARGLSAIVLSLALANATNSSLYATALAASPATSEAVRPLLRACSLKYAAAGDSLGRAIQELTDADSDESNDYAFIHASAAAEYPVACRVMFERRKRQAAAAELYPVELARREDDLKKLCTVAMEIISLLG